MCHAYLHGDGNERAILIRHLIAHCSNSRPVRPQNKKVSPAKTAVSRTLASVNHSERFTGIVRELPSVIECFLFYFFIVRMRFGGFLGLDGNGYRLARLQVSRITS